MKMESYTKKCATFGAMSDDLEQVRTWVEVIVGTPAAAHESSDRGGDYYLFTGDQGEELHVMRNADVYDGEPLVDADPKWAIVVTLDDVPSDSTWWVALGAAIEQFELISHRDY